MDCVNFSVARDDEALRNHPRTPFQDERRIPARPLRGLSGNTMIWNNQQASSIDHILVACTILTPLPNTPPQVDTSAYRYRESGGTKTAFASVVSYRKLHSSAAKKTIARSSQNLFLLYARISNALIIEDLFQRLFVEYASSMNRRFLPEQHFFMKSVTHKRICFSYEPRCVIADIQMYRRLTNTYNDIDLCRAGNRSALRMQVNIAERDKKKQGNQPKPAKPEKPKKDRKDEKGSQRVKRPKVEGPILHIKERRV